MSKALTFKQCSQNADIFEAFKIIDIYCKLLTITDSQTLSSK